MTGQFLGFTEPLIYVIFYHVKKLSPSPSVGFMDRHVVFFVNLFA
jgi:hypothetical protein